MQPEGLSAIFAVVTLCGGISVISLIFYFFGGEQVVVGEALFHLIFLIGLLPEGQTFSIRYRNLPTQYVLLM